MNRWQKEYAPLQAIFFQRHESQNHRHILLFLFQRWRWKRPVHESLLKLLRQVCPAPSTSDRSEIVRIKRSCVLTPGSEKIIFSYSCFCNQYFSNSPFTIDDSRLPSAIPPSPVPGR